MMKNRLSKEKKKQFGQAVDPNRKNEYDDSRERKGFKWYMENHKPFESWFRKYWNIPEDAEIFIEDGPQYKIDLIVKVPEMDLEIRVDVELLNSNQDKSTIGWGCYWETPGRKSFQNCLDRKHHYLNQDTNFMYVMFCNLNYKMAIVTGDVLINYPLKTKTLGGERDDCREVKSKDIHDFWWKDENFKVA